MPVPRAETRADDDDDVDAPATLVRARRRRKRRSWARRKHLGLTTVAIALLVLVVGVLIVVLTWDDGRASFTRQVAAAAGTETASTIPTASTPTTPPVTASSSAPGTQAAGPTTVRGKIAAVGDSRWTLTGSNGLTYTIVVTGDTTLPRKRDFGSFVVGDAISVKGALDQGTITAASVVPAKSG